MGRAVVWCFAGISALSKQVNIMGNKSWWVERSQEPSTYQGLSILAGLFGQWFFGSAEIGQQALQCGLAVAAVIQVGKAEALPGRDFPIGE
jgi:hypothetical protein